jgi:hypothetical protein
MTDSTFPDDINAIPQDTEQDDPERAGAGRTDTGGGGRSDDDRVAAGGETDEPGEVGPDTPGAPSSTEPMTDSTEGGLEGGDPGVEE